MPGRGAPFSASFLASLFITLSLTDPVDGKWTKEAKDSSDKI